MVTPRLGDDTELCNPCRNVGLANVNSSSIDELACDVRDSLGPAKPRTAVYLTNPSRRIFMHSNELVLLSAAV